MDRNIAWQAIATSYGRSLSARRAWIEIGRAALPSVGRDEVALRKESVDRNGHGVFVLILCLGVALRKESVDRNLLRGCRDSVFERVALRKESVDRNARASSLAIRSCGRSPQGERG